MRFYKQFAPWIYKPNIVRSVDAADTDFLGGFFEGERKVGHALINVATSPSQHEQFLTGVCKQFCIVERKHFAFWVLWANLTHLPFM